ncbi:MAG: addiction module protein [Gemmataceae bacterium]
MSELATKLLEQLLALPEAERAQIAERLNESLDEQLEDEIDPAFQAELERRLREVEEHPERLLDGKQVMAELREHLRRKRQQ